MKIIEKLTYCTEDGESFTTRADAVKHMVACQTINDLEKEYGKDISNISAKDAVRWCYDKGVCDPIPKIQISAPLCETHIVQISQEMRRDSTLRQVDESDIRNVLHWVNDRFSITPRLDNLRTWGEEK